MATWIKELGDNDIFVFGSNENGIHGAGAARQALQWGALLGQGFGHFGRTFAIPTKDMMVETLPVEIIEIYVKVFLRYAKNRPSWRFLLTPIGTGLAGIPASKIGPLFKGAPPNVVIPEEFAPYV